MESGLLRIGFACASAALLLACGQQQQTAARNGAGGEGHSQSVVTEHHFEQPLRAQDTAKPIGSDCSAHGADACASRLCLHATASRTSGYVCSKACVGNENCPASWRCAHTYPSAEGAFCVPVNAAL
jgi:hypothetical protein